MPNARPELVEKAVNTIRMLAADGVQQANSGHPGMPMGAADMAFVLWTRHLRFDPAEPRWLGRDRFLLSAGHGSMLLYSLLHLAGFDCALEDLKHFRQLHSRTPGHPEYGFLPGVEITSGPLGQGFANGVGFALGHAMLAAKLGPGNPVSDAFVYAIVSDGDLMEGVSAEAASFAGHHKLGRLVYLYDDNGITIDGKTSITFSGEDVTRRFEAYGWHVQSVDGRDHDGIDRALQAAKAELGRPSLIRVHTTIGFGSPAKAGKSSVHGAPLGEAELEATKKALGWPLEPRFLVPDDVRAYWAEVRAEKAAQKQAWRAAEQAWRAANPEQAALLDAHVERWVPERILDRARAELPAPDATRKVSQAILQKIAPLVPCLVGGSADLAESNLTEIKGAGSVAPGSFAGRNLHFGIREHAMGAIANGLAYDGLFVPFVGTFLQFADYMRPPVRLAALSKLQAVYVWTHDSIFLGEDGPTHQPIEHLTALRAIPNLHVCRPADPEETAAAWAHALQRRDGPTALVLTRQKLAPVKRSVPLDPEAILRGGYLVDAPAGATFTLVATGSEVPLAQAALEALAKQGVVGRLASIPCLECFLAQPKAWRDEVVPPGQRVAVVEAARGTEWWQLAGRDGLVLGIERFGSSAPEKALAEEYGFTPAQVAARVTRWLAG
ncbi:transketolase [Anaeromyxobacter dehalogenans 2CP-1]|uniref:Transketolase n=1 Tax=Anaeromyxobacter dehalogenans (strain ATCC BAA-258 / DSM 21875 / 2CP-1) TaxID=455488 RepID=B8J9W7_ANAD2|nr:transketolase [Anaeromyxobacter dehalogenans]ACL63670.1 transketolase [Anaeromyxobacter dehalogenans 2CP-1]